MKITVISVGKIKEKFLEAGIKEYLKRLSAYAKIKIIEVKDEKEPANCSPLDQTRIKEKEYERVEKHLKEDNYLVALAIEGEMLSSEQLADKLEDLALNGKSNTTFIIGGSHGLSDKILNQANMKLSFSKMTFPHQLMRLILLEQLYRGFKIIKGEKYHK